MLLQPALVGLALLQSGEQAQLLGEGAQPLGEADCEALRDGLVNQPANTISSLGYLLVGIWLGFRLRIVPPAERVWAATYAVMVGLNGVGSVAYHGPQFSGAELLHDLPVVGTLLVGLGVPLRRRLSGVPPLPGASPRRLVAGVACGLLAGAAYFLGRTASPICDPDSPLQPHGVWHLATAAIMGIWALVVWPGSEGEPMVSGGST
jgi:hypothetical protein